MCFICDPPRPGRREDTFTNSPEDAGLYQRAVFSEPDDDKPTLAELMRDERG